jgi:hypothetical protein
LFLNVVIKRGDDRRLSTALMRARAEICEIQLGEEQVDESRSKLRPEEGGGVLEQVAILPARWRSLDPIKAPAWTSSEPFLCRVRWRSAARRMDSELGESLTAARMAVLGGGKLRGGFSRNKRRPGGGFGAVGVAAERLLELNSSTTRGSACVRKWAVICAARMRFTPGALQGGRFD